MSSRYATFALALGLTISSASAEEKKPRVAAKVPAPKPPGLPKAPKLNAPNPARVGQTGGPDNHPGEQLVDRLLKLSPQDREKALSKLPPERRENLTRRLDAISKWPTAQQNRVRSRQELLNSLPPERQVLVRRSVQQFVKMPEDRRNVINQELNKIATLPDDERLAYMNTEEFRNKYSAREQQMLSHLAEITPQP